MGFRRIDSLAAMIVRRTERLARAAADYGAAPEIRGDRPIPSEGTTGGPIADAASAGGGRELRTETEKAGSTERPPASQGGDVKLTTEAVPVHHGQGTAEQEKSCRRSLGFPNPHLLGSPLRMVECRRDGRGRSHAWEPARPGAQVPHFLN